MRKFFILLLLLHLLVTCAQAAELPGDLIDAAPEGAEELLRDAGDWDLSGAGGFTEGISRLLEQNGSSLEGKKKTAAQLGISLASLYNKLKASEI